MGLVSFDTTDGQTRPGLRLGEGIIDLTSASIPSLPAGRGEVPYLAVLSTLERKIGDLDMDVWSSDEVTLGPPVSPTKIVRLEGCYEHDLTDEEFNPHLEELGLHELDWPSLWVAPVSSATGPGSRICLPRSVADARPGVQLAFVMGRRTKSASPEDALAAIAGCTVATTVTAFDEIPGLEGYRMYDTFLPFGPEVVPIDEVSIEDLSLHLDVDGTQLDSQTTADWRFAPGEMVAHASAVMTLEAGDLVLSGDPIRTDHSLSAGEQISSWIEDVGQLENSVGAEHHD